MNTPRWYLVIVPVECQFVVRDIRRRKQPRETIAQYFSFADVNGLPILK